MHQLNQQEALRTLDTEQQRGLSASEAQRRLSEHGPNAFEEKKPKTLLQMFFAQLRDPMIYILMGAVVISGALGEFSEIGRASCRERV